MAVKQIQCSVQEKKPSANQSGFFENLNAMPQGKIIELMQTCIECGMTFHPRHGRTRCPCCQGLLLSKTIVLRLL